MAGPGARIASLNENLGAPRRVRNRQRRDIDLSVAVNDSDVCADGGGGGTSVRTVAVAPSGEKPPPGYGPEGKLKAFYERDPQPEPDDIAATFFSMDSDSLIDTMGISGMSIFARTNTDFMQLIAIALQSFTLQYLIIAQFIAIIIDAYHANNDKLERMDWEALQAGEQPQPPPGLPWILYIMIFCSILLHFLSCLGDLPFSLNILLRIRDIHDTPKELLIAAPIFFVDAVVTPMSQLFIGAMFLTTSDSAVDVLMNSCAVAFISNIDNWILGIAHNIKTLKGDHTAYVVHIPYNVTFSSTMEKTIVICPMLPILFAFGMIYICERLGITYDGIPMEAA